MEAVESPKLVQSHGKWSARLRFLLGAAILWAGLHFIADTSVLPRGLSRPVVVLVGDGGIAAAALVLALCLTGGLIGSLLGRRADPSAGLLTVGLALAIWAYSSGTIDDYLIAANAQAGAPSAAAYWSLLAECFYWLVVVAAVFAIGEMTRHGGWAGVDWRRALGMTSEGSSGYTALVVMVLVATVLMLFLTGPRVGHTYRGQVYFAVAVAFMLATMAARKVAPATGLVWYAAAPVLVAIIGAAVAAWRPALPGAYANINVIPAWGVARALPVEMISVGLVSVLLTLRTSDTLSAMYGAGREPESGS